MIGGGDEIRRRVQEGRTEHLEKNIFYHYRISFYLRPRSYHHELTITRYPIFAPKPCSPALPPRSPRADSRKRSFIQSGPTRALVSTPTCAPRRCTFSPLLENFRGSIECIHRWIERGTAGRESNRVRFRGNYLEFFRVSAIG